jgi:hypothetical protein
MNNFRHGGASASLFIQGENPEDFFALLEDAFAQHQPVFDQEAAIVTDSVHARWILNRRQRAADQYEAGLYKLKPDPLNFIPKIELKEVDLFDRYVTTADRALTRALQKLQLIHKMARYDQRWQFQLEKEKQKLAIHVERFELAKQREERLAAKRGAKEAKAEAAEAQRVHDELDTQSFIASLGELRKEIRIDPEHGPYIPQAVYSAFDVAKGVTLASECSPKNEKIRAIIAGAAGYPTPPAKVIRTYHLKGVAPEHEWLFSDENQRHLPYQEIRKPLTFDEWAALAENE